jgi:hypothetical protein
MSEYRYWWARIKHTGETEIIEVIDDVVLRMGEEQTVVLAQVELVKPIKGLNDAEDID